MEEVKLDVEVRTQVGTQKSRAVRREEDAIPGVVYGGEHKPTTIKFDRRAYEKIRRQHHGEIVFHLDVLENGKKLRDYSAIVKEEQNDCVSGKVLHVDFKRVSLKEKIEVKVPLEAEGEAIGVKRDGGSLDHVLWELDIVCLPTDIPEDIKVDVSALEIGDSVHVKELVLPKGVETQHDPEAMVFSLVPPMKEEEPEEVDEDAEPEVMMEKKEEEGKSEEKEAHDSQSESEAEKTE